MRLLLYKHLDLRRVKLAFEKLRAAIESDLCSTDVRKLHVGLCYRAKFDYANRLLLQFARVSEGEGLIGLFKSECGCSMQACARVCEQACPAPLAKSLSPRLPAHLKES